MMKDTIKIITALMLFFIGGMIYLGYRSTSLLMFRWVNTLGLDNTINNFRSIVKHYPIPDWVMYSLPDGLWILSYMLLIDTIWGWDNLEFKYWLYILPIIGIVSEFLQIAFSCLGTFDIADLFCYIFSILIFKFYKFITNEKVF